MLSSNILVLGTIAILGVIPAIYVGYLLGKARDKAQQEERLRNQKEESEKRLLGVQTEQREALREAREETALFRATIER